MADAGEIKFKVSGEYDGGAIKAAKEDIASFGESAGTIGGDLNKVGDIASSAGDKFAASAGGIREFGRGMADIADPIQAGIQDIPQLSSVMEENQKAIEGTGEAFKQLAPQLDTTVTMLGEAARPTALLAQNADSLASSIAPLASGFTQIQEALTPSVELLPQYASSLHDVSKAMSSQNFGLDDFVQNMSVFDEAMKSNDGFQVIQDHLSKTGQSWDDFTSAVGSDNAQILGDIARQGTATWDYLGSVNEQKAAAGAAARMAGGGADGSIVVGPPTDWTVTSNGIAGVGSAASNATPQMNNFTTAQEKGTEAAATGEKAQASFTDAIGAEQGMLTKTSESLVSTGEMAGKFSGDMTGSLDAVGKSVKTTGGDFAGFFEEAGGVLGKGVGGLMEGLSAVAMPLMAVQMIGMAVGTVATGIYNAAAVAEGAGAHGVGTFTGAVDALGATVAHTSQQFAEGFGQGVIPTLDAMNQVISEGGGAGGFGKFLGGVTSTMVNEAQVAGGVLLAATGMFEPGMALIKSGGEGLINQYAQDNGMPLPFQGPNADPNVAIQQKVADATASLPAQLAISTAQLNYQAQDSSYLAAQANYSYQSAQAQIAQQSWQDSHYAGTTGPTDPMNQILQAEAVRASGQAYGGYPDPNATPYDVGNVGPSGNNGKTSVMQQWWDSLTNPGDPGYGGGAGGSFGGPSTDGGGCFPAGTRILCPGGAQRPIEALRVGEDVLCHDGETQAVATILACISYTRKQVYELTFSNEKSLTLTDGHPVATPNGWKSLSPATSKEENPGLYVLPLHIGDQVYTSDGSLCILLAIQARAIVTVYNITVSNTHTYYANGILVHNKSNALSASTPDSSGAIVKNVPITVTWSLSGILDNVNKTTSGWSLSGILDKVSQQFSGWGLSGILDKNSIQNSGWGLMGQLANMAIQNSGWGLMGQLVQNSVQNSEWGLSGQLFQMATQVSEWALSGELNKQWDAAVQWAVTGTMNKTFQGDVKWAADGLEHLFQATATWQATNLNPVFQVAATFLGLASGVLDNPQAQIAMVGENGPELMYVPQGASVFPNGMNPFGTGITGTGSGTPGLQLGGSGGSSAGPVTIQLVLDSMMVAQSILPQIAPMMRVQLGVRR